MGPAQRRAAVARLQERFGLSPRRACRLVGGARSTVRDRGRCGDDGAGLRARLRELAAQRPRFGYRRPHVLLRREGRVADRRRVERPYRAEGLAVRRRNRKGKPVGRINRGRPGAPGRANDQWALDVLEDAPACGRTIRVLGVLGVSTGEAPALGVDAGLPGSRVVRVLNRLAGGRGRPARLAPDNGPELVCRVLGRWAREQGVAPHLIDPGKPIRNAHRESFHGRVRDGCLNEHRFPSLADARRTVEAWRQDHNAERPHSALGYRTPAAVARETVAAAMPPRAHDGLSERLDQTTGAGHGVSHRSTQSTNLHGATG